MRCITGLLLMLGLSACAPLPSAGIDWFENTAAMQRDGLLRQVRDPADASVSADILARNFLLTTLNPEMDPFGQGLTRDVSNRRFLRKWTKPIAYRLIVSNDEDRARISGRIERFMKRLSILTGVEIFEVPDDADADTDADANADAGADEPTANMLISYGPDLFYQALVSPDLARMTSLGQGPNAGLAWYQETVRSWRTAPSPCAGAMAYSTGEEGLPQKGAIGLVVVLLRKEVPDVLLDSCIEEEIAQSMGPLGDDERLRPSLFNDGSEFAVLTKHDEAILRILYDDRLRPGMTEAEVAPLVRKIISEQRLAD
ncbi:MAG: DUF2927 domain-containing protein [Pseudomonadota bacterium]